MQHKTKQTQSRFHPKVVEPMPEFMQEFVHAYPGLRPLALRAYRLWYQVAKMLGVAKTPQTKPLVQPYCPPPKAKTQAPNHFLGAKTSPLLTTAMLSNAVSIQAALVSEANKLIKQYQHCDWHNNIEKQRVEKAMHLFEHKYHEIDLETLDLEALSLYEQVMELSLRHTTAITHPPK